MTEENVKTLLGRAIQRISELEAEISEFEMRIGALEVERDHDKELIEFLNGQCSSNWISLKDHPPEESIKE